MNAQATRRTTVTPIPESRAPWRLERGERLAYEELWAHVEPAKAREILISALIAFARRGFDAATTRDIAEVSGMSPAGIYVHYSSKLDLLLELITTGHEMTLDAITAALADGPPDPESCVRRFAEVWTSIHARLHTLARVAQYELVSIPQDERGEITVMRRQLVNILRTHIRRGVDAGVFDVADLADATRAVMSLGIDVARWYQFERSRGHDALASEYGEFAIRMLSTPVRQARSARERSAR
jgi:AcrR family transcriptional regulator